MDSSSDQISNCDESQIEEEDLQLSTSTKYNSISFNQIARLKFLVMAVKLVPGLKMMI